MRGYSLIFIGLAMATGLYRVAAFGPPHSAADYAARTQNLVGQGYGPMRIRSVEAENNSVVITVDGPSGWRQNMPSYAMTAHFIDGFCRDGKAAGYFAEGRSLRFDTLEQSRYPIHGAPLDHCPPPSTSDFAPRASGGKY
jgi:hypothetical protein